MMSVYNDLPVHYRLYKLSWRNCSDSVEWRNDTDCGLYDGFPQADSLQKINCLSRTAETFLKPEACQRNCMMFYQFSFQKHKKLHGVIMISQRHLINPLAADNYFFLFVWWCLFKIKCKKPVDLQFITKDCISLVWAPLRISWTIPWRRDNQTMRLFLLWSDSRIIIQSSLHV